MNIPVNSYEVLLAEHQAMHELIYKVAVRIGLKDEQEANEAKIRNSVSCGIYEHFKSTPEEVKHIGVLGVGIVVDTSCICHVTYSSLYKPHVGKLAHRPLTGPNGFLMPIKRGTNKDRPDYEGPRFRLVEGLPFVHVAPKIEAAFYRAYPRVGKG